MTLEASGIAGLPRSGEFVLYDTEYTAWEGSQQRLWSEDWEHRELVELGAVRVRAEDFRIIDKFRRLTVPYINTTLSDYFQDLTGIRQQDVDRDGVPLAELFGGLADFGAGSSLFISNGDDVDVLCTSAALQGIDLPIAREKFRNIRPDLQRVLSATTAQLTTGLLPEKLGLAPAGALHSAIDDAVALARALAELRRTGLI